MKKKKKKRKKDVEKERESGSEDEQPSTSSGYKRSLASSDGLPDSKKVRLNCVAYRKFWFTFVSPFSRVCGLFGILVYFTTPMFLNFSVCYSNFLSS